MRIGRFAIVALVIALFAAPLDARADTPLQRLVLYVPNRALDLLDVVNLSVGAGPGFGAMIRVTRLLNAGYDDYSVIRVGIKKRKGPAWDEEVDEWGIGPVYRSSGEERSPTEIGLTLHPLIGGLEAGLDPWSLVDFVLGFFFVDVEGDDMGS